MANPTTKLNPKYTVTLTIDGKKEQFPLQFDLSEAATKKGTRFASLGTEYDDPLLVLINKKYPTLVGLHFACLHYTVS